jgi:hypothetical protein
VPANGDFKLNYGQQNSVSIPILENDVIWSGAISGKSGCNSSGSNCAKADCGNDGNGSCVPSRGFSQPATQAEMTIAKNNVDFYDIEIINGVHMGVSMQPANA